MGKGGGGDQGIPLGMWIWDVERGTAKSRLRVDGEDAVGKSAKDLFFEPFAKRFPLRAVPPLDEQDSDFKFKDGDG